MNLSPETVKAEIWRLFGSLNEQNYDSVVTELSQYIEFGVGVSILLGEICFDNHNQDLNNSHLQPAICTLFKKLMEKPHFGVVFSSLVKDTSVSEEFLDDLSGKLQLSGFEKLGFGLALYDSENNDVRIAGMKFCMSWCEALRGKSVFSKHADSFRKMIIQIFEAQSVLTPSETMVSSPEFTTPSQADNLEAPSIETRKMMSFILNQLTDSNIEASANYFTGIMKEKYYPWFAQYLVMERASREPDSQKLYIKFVERTSSKQLNKDVVRASYEICKVVSSSELIKSSSGMRQMLKNLGSWLGKLTIGRNQALLAKHIDPKSLLLKAYEKGLLIGIIPFIAKIMESCEISVAYKPPNVWTMAILELLAEICATENLLAGLRFEIEVLVRKLKVDTTEIDPTSLLENRVRIIKGNYDLKKVSSTVISPQRLIFGKRELSQQLPLEIHHKEDARPANYYPNWEHFNPSPTFYLNLPEQGNLYAWNRIPHVPQQILPGLNLRDEARPATFSPNLLVQGNTCALREPNSENVHSFFPQQSVVKELAWHPPKQMNSDVFSPGLRNSPRSMGSTSITIQHPLTTGAALDEFQILSKKLENLIVNDAKEAEIKPVIAEVLAIIPRCKSKDDAVLAVAQKVLYSGNGDKKFNKDVTVGLIRKKLLNLPEYTIHMAKLIDAQKNDTAAKFAISLVETLKTSDDKVISEFQHMVDALAKVAKHSEASRKAIV